MVVAVVGVDEIHKDDNEKNQKPHPQWNNKCQGQMGASEEKLLSGRPEHKVNVNPNEIDGRNARVV